MNHPSSILAAVFVATRGLVCHAESHDSTQWIWESRGSRIFDTAETFDIPSSPKTARLKCAVDFCTATVWLNDKVACDFHGSIRIQTVDASRFLKQGSNRIRLSAKRIDGPAAIAYELEIVMEDGLEQIVRSSDRESESAGCGSSRRQFFGDIVHEPWWSIERSPNVSVFDEYNQWEEAVSGSAEKEFASFQIPDGFEIELVYSAKPEHGSWVSMATDDRGRILLGKEDSGILRLTIPKNAESEPIIETLNSTLESVQGLLLSANGLIASANRSLGLYRLNQSSGGSPFDKVTLLQETVGSQGDHGRHDLVQDAKGRIYVIHGDSVQIPHNFTSLVPATNEFQNKKPEAGHVIQTDVDGTTWKVFCSGLRNPYGLTLNNVGECFTYDADAEAHTGLPWYRPTRIVHLMPGVDYGWRTPGIPWPGYLPDTMPPIATIGRGSPTSLKFAYASNFPAVYRRALFALDWSCGRILAVHLAPKGSTYSAHAEVFVRGRPFSVCDLDFDDDGSMLVITGGRGTQSRLYRIRYVGSRTNAEPDSQQVLDRSKYSSKMREQRCLLESLYDERGPMIVHRAWNNLSHPDRGIRSAARILLEHQPPSTWQDRLWNEQEPKCALPALLALVRTGKPELFPKIHQKLHSLSLTGMSELQMAIRIESLVDRNLPRDDERSGAIRVSFDSRFPSGRRSVDRELCRLLVEHQSEVVVDRTLDVLADETNQIDKFHYLVCLADATTGWNTDRHDEFFRLLSGARLYITDEGLDDRVQRLFDIAIRQVAESRQAEYQDLFATNSTDRVAQVKSLPFINRWTVSKIIPQFRDVERSTDVENGAQVFRIANCNRCHRFGTTGRPFGPDLSTVASRFSRKYILEQIVEPSKTISAQYRNYTIALKNGKVINGQVVYNGFRKSILRVATDPTALHETTEIKKDDIESFHESGVSPMPERLLDTLSIEQITDLLAYLESGMN